MQQHALPIDSHLVVEIAGHVDHISAHRLVSLRRNEISWTNGFQNSSFLNDVITSWIIRPSWCATQQTWMNPEIAHSSNLVTTLWSLPVIFLSPSVPTAISSLFHSHPSTASSIPLTRWNIASPVCEHLIGIAKWYTLCVTLLIWILMRTSRYAPPLFVAESNAAL